MLKFIGRKRKNNERKGEISCLLKKPTSRILKCSRSLRNLNKDVGIFLHIFAFSLGAVRDRLFHAMLVRVAISYNRHVPMLGKRFIEFSSLVTVSYVTYIRFFV